MKVGARITGSEKMKPIEFHITRRTLKSSRDLCAEFLNTARWSEFSGYGILPGIANAQFELLTKDIVGSRIQVKNRDGSTHVEVITAWDVDQKIAVRFQEFRSPLESLATHFIESWEFRSMGAETEVTRRMTMYPRGWSGWLMLLPISILMKKAFEKNANQLNEGGG
jgi:hypothetical protein